MAFGVTNTFTANTTAEAAKVNTNFSEIETELNDFPTDGALGSGVVDTTQLAADAVTSAQIADDAVDSEHFVDGGIDTAHLADDAVTDAKINAHGAVKGWINFNGTGTPVIRDSYNVTSITDNGVGNYTITWDTDFANANYVIVGIASTPGVINAAVSLKETPAAGSVNIVVINIAGSQAVDVTHVYVMALGDQ